MIADFVKKYKKQKFFLRGSKKIKINVVFVLDIIQVDAILKQICKYFNVSSDDLIGLED